MDMFTLGVLLVVIGLILLILEVHTPGFFIAIPGTIILVLGVAMLFMGDNLDVTTASVLVLISAVGASAVTLSFYKIIGKSEPPTTTTFDRLVGEHGIVISKIKPNSLSGKVKVNSEIWSATADHIIEEGTEVIVLKGEGVHLKVREVK